MRHNKEQMIKPEQDSKVDKSSASAEVADRNVTWYVL